MTTGWWHSYKYVCIWKYNLDPLKSHYMSHHMDQFVSFISPNFLKAIPCNNVKEPVQKRIFGHRYPALDPVFVLAEKHLKYEFERECFISILLFYFFSFALILNQMCEGNFHKSDWALIGHNNKLVLPSSRRESLSVAFNIHLVSGPPHVWQKCFFVKLHLL